MRIGRRNLRKGLLAVGCVLGAPSAVGLPSAVRGSCWEPYLRPVVLGSAIATLGRTALAFGTVAQA